MRSAKGLPRLLAWGGPTENADLIQLKVGYHLSKDDRGA